MMDAMPRPRPPHLHREVDPARQAPSGMCGSGKGPRIRLASGIWLAGIRGRVPGGHLWYAAAAEGRAGHRHTGMADGALPRNRGMVRTVAGHAQAAREHLQAGARERRRTAVRQDHGGCDRCRPRATRRHAASGATLPRRHARPVPMGGKGGARQCRSDGRRRESAASEGRWLPSMDRGARRGIPAALADRDDSSAYGSTCCSTADCAAATPSDSAASMSATALAGSRRKRAGSR